MGLFRQHIKLYMTLYFMPLRYSLLNAIEIFAKCQSYVISIKRIEYIQLPALMNDSLRTNAVKFTTNELPPCSNHLMRLLERIAYAQTKIDNYRLYLNQSCCCPLLYRHLFLQLTYSKGASYETQLRPLNIDYIMNACRRYNGIVHEQIENELLLKQVLSNYFEINGVSAYIHLDHFISVLMPRYKATKNKLQCVHTSEYLDKMWNKQILVKKFANLIDVIISEYLSVEKQRRHFNHYEQQILHFLQSKYGLNERASRISGNLLNYMNRGLIKQFMIDKQFYNEVTYRKICFYLFGHQHSSFSQFSKELTNLCMQRHPKRQGIAKQLKQISHDVFEQKKSDFLDGNDELTYIKDQNSSKTATQQSRQEIKQLFDDVCRLENKMKSWEIKDLRVYRQRCISKNQLHNTYEDVEHKCKCQRQNAEIKELKDKLKQIESRLDQRQRISKKQQHIESKMSRSFDRRILYGQDQRWADNFDKQNMYVGCQYGLTRAQSQATFKIKEIERRAMLKYMEIRERPICFNNFSLQAIQSMGSPYPLVQNQAIKMINYPRSLSQQNVGYMQQGHSIIPCFLIGKIRTQF